MPDAWAWFERNKKTIDNVLTLGGIAELGVLQNIKYLHPIGIPFIATKLGMLAGEWGLWDYFSRPGYDVNMLSHLRLSGDQHQSWLNEYRKYDAHDAGLLAAISCMPRPLPESRFVPFNFPDQLSCMENQISHIQQRIQEIDSSKAMERRWLLGGPQLNDFVTLMPRLEGFSPSLSGSRGAPEATLFVPTAYGSPNTRRSDFTLFGQGFSPFDQGFSHYSNNLKSSLQKSLSNFMSESPLLDGFCPTSYRAYA
ncbi:MAG: hypothetical protein GY774_31880 [Planctomycetes bacterium]|nr:hypothetical protein [Planctomycetota bacterium]